MTIKKFKTLPMKEKIDYLLFDLSWQIFLGAILLFLLGSWIYLDYMVEPPVLNVEMIDGNADSPNSEAFSDFMEAQGLICTDESVKLSKKIQIGQEPGDIPCHIEPLLMCRAMEGKTDLYFWNDDGVEHTLAMFDLVDLRTVLTPEMLKACEDRLVYTGPLLEGGFPCGIRLEDCSWIQDNGFYEHCVVGISRSAENPALLTSFIEYIT